MRLVILGIGLALLGCAPAAPAATPTSTCAEPPSAAMTKPAPAVINAASAADPCASERTTLAMENCVTERLRQVEAEIQAALVRFASVLVARGVADANAVVAASQADWERYRSSQCSLFEKLSEGGSLARVAVAYCRLDLTDARLANLRSLEESVVE